MTGEANRVFVQVPQSLGSDQSCLGQTRAKSIAVKAYMVIIWINHHCRADHRGVDHHSGNRHGGDHLCDLCEPQCLQVERQSSFGCYHPEAAGLLPNDVHVIDLRDRTGSGQNGRRLRRSVAEEQLPEVVVELGPELTEGGFSTFLHLHLPEISHLPFLLSIPIGFCATPVKINIFNPTSRIWWLSRRQYKEASLKEGHIALTHSQAACEVAYKRIWPLQRLIFVVIAVTNHHW